MPQLGDTSVFPDAAEVYVDKITAIIGYSTPIAFISSVKRISSNPDVDILEGSEESPQWGQG